MERLLPELMHTALADYVDALREARAIDRVERDEFMETVTRPGSRFLMELAAKDDAASTHSAWYLAVHRLVHHMDYLIALWRTEMVEHESPLLRRAEFNIALGELPALHSRLWALCQKREPAGLTASQLEIVRMARAPVRTGTMAVARRLVNVLLPQRVRVAMRRSAITFVVDESDGCVLNDDFRPYTVHKDRPCAALCDVVARMVGEETGVVYPTGALVWDARRRDTAEVWWSRVRDYGRLDAETDTVTGDARVGDLPFTARPDECPQIGPVGGPFAPYAPALGTLQADTKWTF